MELFKLKKGLFLKWVIIFGDNFSVMFKLTGLFLLIEFAIPVAAQVKVYQKSLTLPTYGVEKPEIMPEWKQYRYPYPMFDRLTNERGEKTYNALYVENEYVKALVLPEIGGRLHGATDKTNGYEFLYDQKVIKPGLVSTTGAWISGGVEWNFPIGHRPSCFRDVDWTLTKNEDGSKTVWTGEIDRMTGMRWSVGTTVHPGRSWLETKVRLYNCTPYVQRFQYWATSAVRATLNYQAVIPGKIMTGHGKHEYYHWPVNEGVDISYWKNITGAGSYFAVNSQSNYFGGYSPEKSAGIVHFADHHIVRGKKLWTWGTAPAGRLWEKILTDGDLPYFEPQAGAYSDNQPSLFWIMPGETKIFSHFWFSVRDIGVFDYANLEGSLNLELSEGKARFGWSPTGVNKDAVVIVSGSGKEIFRKKITTDPANPFMGESKVPDGIDLYQLKMIALSSDGDTLLSFSHSRPENLPLPEPKPAPLSPEQIKSQDKLYVIADRLNKYNEMKRAKQYYQEVLKKDPGDIRTNTALGEMALKDGKFSEALQYFDISLDRDEDYFKAWYNKGLTQLWLNDLKGAEISLNRSTYSLEWYAAAHFELAQLALKGGQSQNALAHIERSISGNSDNTEACAIKAIILCELGKIEQAQKILTENIKFDPLNHFLQAVKIEVLNESGVSESEVEEATTKLDQLLRFDSENFIELAIRFARIGKYDEAVGFLDKLINKEGATLTSMVFYYKAFYEHLSEKNPKDVLDLASATDPTYCFPNRLESFPVLEWALKINSDDANAHHLLATLLYSRSRTEEAVSHWESSVALNPENAVAYRNLGLVYHKLGNLQKAKEAYQAALKADPSAGKVIVELGLLNKEMNIPYKEQIDLFEKNIAIASTYNQAVSQLVELYVLVGHYNKALDWLQKTHFNSWEGRYGIHQLWVQSNINLGDVEMIRKDYEKALEYYRQSLDYPFNLEVAEQPNTIHVRKYFKIAQALEAQGKKKEAKTYYNKIIAYTMDDGNAYQFFRGKALEALGEKKKATEIYEKMLAALNEGALTEQQGEDPMLQAQTRKDQGAIELFTRSLALEGLNRISDSKKLREEALKMYPMVELGAFSPPRSGY